MERLRITELLADYNASRDQKVTKAYLGEVVMSDDPGRPRRAGGRGSELSESRKRTIIGEWDAGKSLTAMKPRHVMRLAKFFRIERIDDLFEE